MKELKKRIWTIAAAVLVVAAAFGMGAVWKGTRGGLVQEKEAITQDILQQQIQEIGELATAKYYYTNMGRYENTLQVGGKNIPFTQKMFIISYDGTVKAGVELKDIRVTLEDRVIRVVIPEAKILSHEVDMESVTVFDEKNSIFNGLATEDVTRFLTEQHVLMEEKAVVSGILEDARQNAGNSLKTLYQALLKEHEDDEEGYTLEVEFE